MKGKRKKKYQPQNHPLLGGSDSGVPTKETARDKPTRELISFFPTNEKLNELALDNAPTPEIHVPSPDDADLPCNRVAENLLMKNKGSIKLVCESNYEDKRCTDENDGNIKPQKRVPPLKIILTNKKKSSKKGGQEPKQKTLNDYFPVRRSDRKPLCAIKKEKEKEIEEAIVSGKEDGFEVAEFIGKGRGVIANKCIKRGEFALEYHGDLIDTEEAKQREKLYSKEEDVGCYMYYFKHKNRQYCVDATKESGRLGRLVNHSQKGNLTTKTFTVNGKPHLILVACKDIQPGEELLYDYGDRRKESLEFYPWLSQ